MNFGKRTESTSNSSALMNQGTILNARFNKIENQGEEMTTEFCLLSRFCFD